MQSYLISSYKDIRAVYLPERSFFNKNPFRQILIRTDKALKSALWFGDSPGAAALSFDEDKFLKNATLEDFKKDVYDIVSENKWNYLNRIRDFTKNQLSRDMFEYHLQEVKKDIDHSIELLATYRSTTLSLDRAVIDILSESYQSVLDELFSQYDHLHPGIFQAPVLITESGSKKQEETVKPSLAGLILNKTTMPTGRANKLCKWLKKAELIHKDTKHQTLRNIFVTRKIQGLTKVHWTCRNVALKYLINQLHEAEIIKPSGYLQKWIDVASVFINEEGEPFLNTNFSKNSDPINPEIQKKIDDIMRKLKADIYK